MTEANRTEEQRVRETIAAELRKRAGWLRSQSDKGYYVIPSAKADECVWLADRIEKGITP